MGIVLILILILVYLPEEKPVTELEPGKLVLTDCEVAGSDLPNLVVIHAIYPIVRNVGGQSIRVDNVLCYFGNRIGISTGGIIEPGKEKTLGYSYMPEWGENNKSQYCGAENPERSTTIRFILFENVSTEGMSEFEIYQALKKREIGNVILEDEIVYTFENIVYEIRIDKSWSFNTSEYECPYTINFETMRITNKLDGKDPKESYKWAVFEFFIEYEGTREGSSEYDCTLWDFELEVDNGYIYDVDDWRESWLYKLCTRGSKLCFKPGETYKGEIGFEILEDTEPVSLQGLYGFASIQIDLKTSQ